MLAKKPVCYGRHLRLTLLVQARRGEVAGKPAQVFPAVPLQPCPDMLRADRLEKTLEFRQAEDRPPLAIQYRLAHYVHDCLRINPGRLDEHLHRFVEKGHARSAGLRHSTYRNFGHGTGGVRTQQAEHFAPHIAIKNAVVVAVVTQKSNRRRCQGRVQLLSIVVSPHA